MSSDRNSNSRLALAVFFATLLGTLIGLAADLNDALAVLGPLYEITDPSPRIHLVGSSTMLGEGLKLATAWREEFVKRKTQTVNLDPFGELERPPFFDITSVGSVKGVELIADGSGQILASSEPINPDYLTRLQRENIELECAAEVGYDIIAFVSDASTELPMLTTRQISGILAGLIDNWMELGGPDKPLQLVIRHGSGTTDLVLRRFTDSPEYPRRHIPCHGNDECLNITLNTPGSLYFVSTAWLFTQRGAAAEIAARTLSNSPGQQRVSTFLNVVPLANPLGDLVNPLDPQLDLDQYPRDLVRPLYLYVFRHPKTPQPVIDLARDFMFFVRSLPGQAITQTHYFFTFFKPPEGIVIGSDLPRGFVTRDGVPTVCRP